ncbi:MAG TPA: CHAT domain-containing protein [Pyrinomonadaceae bacterium]|jgi:CHAT domain-containing protein/tetratricopeptide (TPR) repeat protein
MKSLYLVYSLIFLLFLTLGAVSASSQTIETGQSLAADEENARKLRLEWNRNSLEASRSIYLKNAGEWRKLKRKEKELSCLREAANISLMLGDKLQATAFLNQALKAVTNNQNNDEKAKILSELSLIALENGQINQSQIYFEKAISAARESGSDAALAQALFSAGDFFYFRDDLIKSLNSYKQSIEYWKKTGDLIGEGKALLSLGYLLVKQNDYNSGLETFKSALSTFRQINDKRGEAFSYTSIGATLMLMNEKQNALEHYKKAEKLFHDDLDFTEKAALSNDIGAIYGEYGDWKLSLNYRKTAFRLFQKIDNLYGQLHTLPSLGNLSSYLHEDADALDYFRQAEALAVKLEDSFTAGVISEDLGNHFFDRRDFEKALFYYKKSLRSFNKDIHKRQLSEVYYRMGRIYKETNNSELSKQFLSASLKLNHQVKDNFSEAETVFQLAEIQNSEGKNADALDSVKRSLAITESLYSDVLNSKLKTAYFSNVFDRYELYINLLMKMHNQSPGGNYAIEALQAAEKSRARLMLEKLSLSEADFNKDADAETVRREKEIRVLLNTKSDKLTDLLSGDAEKSEIDKISGEINELENELEEIKANLKQNSPIYSAIKNPAPFDVGEFQNEILDENSLLLEFSFGAKESYLWLVGKNEIDSYVLAPRAEIESRIENLRALLAAPREIKQGEAIEDFQQRINESEKAFEREALALSEMLFGQIAGKLPGKRLIIVPDGKLHYFPVSALPLPNAETSASILYTNETVYEPSAQTLTLLKKSRNDSPAAKKFLVFSDPVFSNDDARLSGTGKTAENASSVETTATGKLRFAESLNSLSRLPASKTEADSIIEIIGGSPEDSFSGFEANRERLLNAETSDYKIIHFATHGLINEQRPQLSGIVLSRFDKDGRQIDESIRLHDIYGLNLNADLVVLSACNTGLGKEVKGEGLMSLNNAFLQVGAKAVVSSLWKVRDEATEELMKDFYQGLTSKKLTSSAALRQAQIKLSQNPQYKSPFFWAAFTIQGDFANTPKLSPGFGYWVYFLLIIPFLTFGVYRFGKAGLFNRKIVVRR